MPTRSKRIFVWLSKAGPDEIAGALTKWMAWAQRCWIPVFRELRKKIKRHFNSIVKLPPDSGLSNARSEAINNIIKLINQYRFLAFATWIIFSLWLCSPAPIFPSHSPNQCDLPIHSSTEALEKGLIGRMSGW